MAGHQLILSLGGNLGNKAEIFAETLDLIQKDIGDIQLVSPVYETPPWGFEAAGLFWNQVILVKTGLNPAEVLLAIRDIESHFGRERQPGRYLSRKMDIDILFYDNLVLQTDELTIPHPLMASRRFVLAPLADVVPDLIHPVSGLTVSRMLEVCEDKLLVVRLASTGNVSG